MAGAWAWGVEAGWALVWLWPPEQPYRVTAETSARLNVGSLFLILFRSKPVRLAEYTGKGGTERPRGPRRCCGRAGQAKCYRGLRRRAKDAASPWNSENFTVAPDGSGLKNVSRNPLLDSSPMFSADGREIVFARDTYGLAQLYRMDINGDRQRRVTDAPGYEMSPAVSPDGIHLAFAGDRESRGFDIFSIDLRQPGDEKRVAARRLHDVLPSFSPDGRRIVFSSNRAGSFAIHQIDA